MAKPKHKPATGIGPTPERRRQVKIDVVPSLEKGGKAHRVREPLTVDAWRARGRLTLDEHSAAIAFANLYQRANGSLCSISRYDPDPRYASGETAQEATVALRRAYRVTGARHARWLDGIIIHGESLRSLERRASVRSGTGLEHFKVALRVLAVGMGWPMGG